MDFRLLNKYVLAGVLLIVVALLVGNANAYTWPPNICSSNGHFDGVDCEFIKDPAEAMGCPQHVSYSCNSWPSKYKSGCYGSDYYDYSVSFASFNAWKDSAGKCWHGADNCYASISYNDARCTGAAPSTQLPSTPVPPSTPTTPSTPSSTDYGYSNYFPIGTNPYCSVRASPRNLQRGQTTNVFISYSGYSYNPWSMSVDCGNGYSNVAFCTNTGWDGYGGLRGYCSTTCNYQFSGTYYVNSFWNYCSGTSVNVGQTGGSGGDNGGGSGGSGGTQPAPQPPLVYPKSCSVSTNPSELEGKGTTTTTVTYGNFKDKPTGAKIVCGNGQAAEATCSGVDDGSCITTCSYEDPKTYPKIYAVEASIDGFSCGRSSVKITEPYEPTILEVTVANEADGKPIEGALVQVDGRSHYSDASGKITVNEIKAGFYTVIASKDKYADKTRIVEVKAEQTNYATIKLKAEYHSACSTSINPGVFRAGGSTTVTVAYGDARSKPMSAGIACGNGQSVAAACTGTADSGICTATCTYGEEQSYPVYYTITSNVDGTACSTAQAKVVAPLPTDGNLVTRVTYCDDGKPVVNARVRVFNETFDHDYYADEYGKAVSDLGAGQYTIEAHSGYYNVSKATATIVKGETTTKTLCISMACDYAVEIVRAPECQSVQAPFYQVKFTNKLNEANALAIAYSNPSLNGPTTVALTAFESKLVDLNAQSMLGVTAGSIYSLLSIKGKKTECASSLQLPVCYSSGIELSAVQASKAGAGGEKTCFDLLVRNKGLYGGLVTLTASASDSSNMKAEFDRQSFVITPLEVRNAEFCVTPSEGASGTTTFIIKASSPISDSATTVGLSVSSYGNMHSDFAGCQSVDAAETRSYAVTLSNDAVDGDYSLELTDNEIATLATTKLYNFASGTSRSVYLSIQPYGTAAGEHRFDLLAKKGGRTIFQQSLCFNVKGVAMASTQLSAAAVTVPRGAGKTVFLTVSNSGSLKASYTAKTQATTFKSITLTPDAFSLEPGESRTVDVHVAPDSGIDKGAYTIPLKVYGSGMTSTSALTKHEVNFDCGNGRMTKQDCEGGDSTCSASCYYPDTGMFSPQASIVGRTCPSDAAQVRVLDSTNNACIIRASPNNIESGNTVTATLNYYALQNGVASNVEVLCGNGDKMTATGCSGNTGSCSAQCTYGSTGTYTISATAGGVTCYGAKIKVSSASSSSCALTSAPQTIVKGDSAVMTLKYYNVPQTAGTVTTTQLGNIYLGTENLVVTVVEKGEAVAQQLTNAELAVSSIPPQQMFPSTSVSIPLTIRNNNYFTVTSLIAYLKNLPPGFTAQPVQPFNLEPNTERTVYFRLEATASADAGTYKPSVVVESISTKTNSQEFSVLLMISPENQMNVEVASSLAYSVEVNKTRIVLKANVTNNEQASISFTASLELPENWAYTLEPKRFTLGPNGETELTAVITPFDYDAGKTYNATLHLQAADGRAMNIPMQISGKNPEDTLAGLISAAEASQQLPWIILAALLVGAALLYIATGAFINAGTSTGK